MSPDEVEFFRVGVVVERGLLGPADLAEVEMALERYRRDVLPYLPEEDYVLESDRESVRNFWRMHIHDAFFREFMKRPAFLERAARCVRGRPEPLGVETFYKPARVGSAVPYHQDNAYFCFAPPDVVTLWIALDHVTPQNGAVEYLLESHRELVPHRPSGVQGNSFALADAPPRGAYTVFQPSLAPGDALLHHSQIIHRSRANSSPRSRRSLVIVYRGAHTRKDPNLEAEYEKAVAAMRAARRSAG